MTSSDPRYLILVAVVAALLPLVPTGRWRLAVLVAINYAIYMTLSPWYGLLLLVVSASAFAGAHVLAAMPMGRARTSTFIAVTGVILAPLLTFKYAVAALADSQAVAGGPWMAFALPIGLSFYTFQALGYFIDVFVGTIAPERGAVRFASFMSFFPQLTAGPIERARHLLPQLDEVGRVEPSRAVSGLRCLLLGLVLKVVVADTLGPIVDRVYEQPLESSAADVALATFYFSWQVYADFAGYSLIAIGSARLLGVDLLPNFAQPYLSEALVDFWRNWHMSLSGWFRDYVFTPLHFHWRRMRTRGMAAALIVTFLLIGLWHGSEPKYALFGLLHGCLMAVGMLTLTTRARWRTRLHLDGPLSSGFRILFVFGIVTLSFVLFRAGSIHEAGGLYRKLASLSWGLPTVPLLWPCCLIGFVLIGDVLARVEWSVSSLPTPIRWGVYHVGAASVIAASLGRFLAGAPHVSHFIYNRF